MKTGKNQLIKVSANARDRNLMMKRRSVITKGASSVLDGGAGRRRIGTIDLSSFYSLSRTIARSLDLRNNLRTATLKILKIFSFGEGRAYLLDNKSQELCLVSPKGYPKRATLTKVVKPGMVLSVMP